LGLSGYPQQIEMKCTNGVWISTSTDKVTISLDKILKVSCKRVMEPLIKRDEGSSCSKGYGADGRTDNLDNITLVTVGWQFNDAFLEQVLKSFKEI
jgi:hypothetical protein